MFVETILVVIHLTDLLSVSIQKRKNLYSFCGFLSSVYCILVTYSLHRKNRFNNNYKVESSGARRPSRAPPPHLAPPPQAPEAVHCGGEPSQRHLDRELLMPQSRAELALTAPLSSAHGASNIIRHGVSMQKNKHAQRLECLEGSCSGGGGSDNRRPAVSTQVNPSGSSGNQSRRLVLWHQILVSDARSSTNPWRSGAPHLVPR